MTASTITRTIVILLIALLAADASWCCDEISVGDSASTMSAKDACTDGVSLDCHACVCSGTALIETTPPYAPPEHACVLPAAVVAHPTSAVTVVDVPPDERG